jgi:hypothetical protein
MSEEVANNSLANEVMVTIIDADRALHDRMPVGLANVVLAALTAEPETLEELEAAVARYDRPVLREGFLKHFSEGVSEEPYDAGVMIIDLPGRFIAAATEPVLYSPAPCGYALYCPDPPPDWSKASEEEIVWVNYRLSRDWFFIGSIKDWRAIAEECRAEHAADPPFDARPVLFGKVTEFIARQCALARIARMEDPIAAIHEEWLMTPRDDLRGRTPREVLLTKREFVDRDLESRAHQWSFTGQCPQPLKRESAAYRFAGFGTHSNVVYFDLVRFLLDECWEHVRTDPPVTLAEETARLERLKDGWLKDGGGFSHIPEWVLEQERLRVPVTASAEELMIDEDCPVCQMAADPEFGPTFWHLDGSGMDLEDNWVFSFHPTRESWEAERREWEEESREYERKRAQREAETEWAGGARIFDDRKIATENEYDDDVPF